MTENQKKTIRVAIFEAQDTFHKSLEIINQKTNHQSVDVGSILEEISKLHYQLSHVTHVISANYVKVDNDKSQPVININEN